MCLCVRACVRFKASLKGNEMFIVCVTDAQPKECNGVLKRLMDVVTVRLFDRLYDEGNGGV